MNKWVEIRSKGRSIVGQVVCRKQLANGVALGIDVNGEGDIFYVYAREVHALDGK